MLVNFLNQKLWDKSKQFIEVEQIGVCFFDKCNFVVISKSSHSKNRAFMQRTISQQTYFEVVCTPGTVLYTISMELSRGKCC